MDVPLIANKVNPSRTDKSSVDIKSKKHVIDVDVEEDGDALWTDSSLLKEVTVEIFNYAVMYSLLLN